MNSGVENNDQILTVEELSVLIKMKKKTIQNRLSERLPLPPSFIIPESRLRLWRKSDVLQWLNKIADEYIEQERLKRDQFNELSKIAKRGRPLKKRTG